MRKKKPGGQSGFGDYKRRIQKNKTPRSLLNPEMRKGCGPSTLGFLGSGFHGLQTHDAQTQ
jgi:hypothetical protein